MESILFHRDPLLLMALIGFAALAVNVPLGYLREGRRRYSPAWFLYVHLSVPLIGFLRISSHLTPWIIPVFILCAVAGQILGGRTRRRWAKGR
jgi:hypothetical protein